MTRSAEPIAPGQQAPRYEPTGQQYTRLSGPIPVGCRTASVQFRAPGSRINGFLFLLSFFFVVIAWCLSLAMGMGSFGDALHCI